MLVMHVRRMRVLVLEPAMCMGMRMRRPGRVFRIVLMLVMFVMDV
jgi:hypothetical protein